jgi:hypothetical protein
MDQFLGRMIVKLALLKVVPHVSQDKLQTKLTLKLDTAVHQELEELAYMRLQDHSIVLHSKQLLQLKPQSQIRIFKKSHAQ